jgi:hypothetical protein
MSDEFRKILQTKYRVRSFDGQKEEMRRAVRLIADALKFPDFGAFMRPGVTFTRWQFLRIKFYIWLGKTGWAQAIILKAMRDNTDQTP